jgi:plastocyanin
MLVIALAAAVVTTAAAGVLRGELSLAGGRARGRHFDDAVVWIAQLPEPVEKKLVKVGFRLPWKAKPKAHVPTLVETGHHYEPRVSVLVVGAPIEVRNEDKVWHGTFSVTRGGAFDLGKRAPGSVDTLRFAKPGQFSMRCDIHPDMSGWIAVTPNHAYARVDESGQWQLPSLPPGDYELHAWHPDRGETRVAVHVPARGDTLIRLHW